MGERWSEHVKDDVVRLYREGKSYRLITEETGVPQATIQHIVKTRGEAPRRGGRVVDGVDYIARADAALREQGRLEMRVRELEDEVARLNALLERYRNNERMAGA